MLDRVSLCNAACRGRLLHWTVLRCTPTPAPSSTCSDKGWSYRITNDQINVEVCPFCANSSYKLYIARGGNKDGLWQCFVCNSSGNLRSWMETLGDRLENVQSLQEERRGAPLPNVEAAHQRLLDDPEALDYLLSTRGFSLDVVRQMKLGLDEYDSKKWLLFPYINKGRSYSPSGARCHRPRRTSARCAIARRRCTTRTRSCGTWTS